MQQVGTLLSEKGTEVFSIAPGATVAEAVDLMAQKGIGSLLVMRQGDLCGIVTERDYARKVILEGRASSDTPVADIMTCEVVVTSPEQSVQECMGLMTEHRIRHLPVLDEIKEEPNPGKRLGALLKAKGPAGAFAWDVTAEGMGKLGGDREPEADATKLRHTTLATSRLRFLFLAAKIWRHAGLVPDPDNRIGADDGDHDQATCDSNPCPGDDRSGPGPRPKARTGLAEGPGARGSGLVPAADTRRCPLHRESR